MIFLHRLEPLQVLRGLDIEEAGAAPDHKNLANFLFHGKLPERLLGPLVAARCVDRGGMRGLFSRTQAASVSGKDKWQGSFGAYGNDSRRSLGEFRGSVRAVNVCGKVLCGKSCCNAFNGFPLNLRIITEALQPRDIRLAAEPSHLALGIVSVGLLSGLQRLFSREFSAYELDCLFVAERRQRPRFGPVSLQ